MEEARSAGVSDPQQELPANLPANLNRAGLVKYYAAVAACESASETGFRFHREEEGSRFVFYTGPDPLFGSVGNDRRQLWPSPALDQPVHPGKPGGPADAGDYELGEPARWLKRTAHLAAEKVYYGYPLAVTAGGELLPVLFASWPVSGEELQINPALLPADAKQRRLIWRKLTVLRGVLAEGSEPDPRKVQAFRAVLASLVEVLGLGPGGSGAPGAFWEGAPPAAAGGEARALVQAGAEAATGGEAAVAAAAEAEAPATARAAVKANVGAVAGDAAPALCNCSILFRGSTPGLPLWLWEDWQYLLERPAALGEIWAGNEGGDRGRQRDAVGDSAASQDEAAEATRDEAGEEGGDASPRQTDGMPTAMQGATPVRMPAPDCPLLLSPFSPAERERLGRALRTATRRRGWSYLDVPANDHLQEYLFHLILNGWYAGLRVLVLVPGASEARRIHDRFAAITSVPTVAIWGGAAERQRTFADLQWMLRSRRDRRRILPPDEPLGQACEAQLKSAWLELRRSEEMVEHAAEAGKSLAALEKELKEAAAGLPSSLLALAEREVRRAKEGSLQLPGSAKLPGTGKLASSAGLPGSAAGGLFGALSKEVEGFLREAERVAAGRWYWSERLWPWQRRRRALSRLEMQVRSLLHRFGLSSGDWFVAPPPGDAEEMCQSLRLLQAALNFADLLGRYQQVKLEAGAGAWDSPESLPRLLAEGWAALAGATRAAARARREFELDSLPDGVIDRLELLPRLQTELAAAAGSPAGQELERAWNESFATVLPALPVWIVPLADAVEPLPPVPALFDLLVVGGAERIPLAAVLPLAARAFSVVLVGDARSEAETLGERIYLHTGSQDVHQQLAFACGLRGLDYVLSGWPVSSLRWLRQQSTGAAKAPAEGYLRHKAFPLGALLNRLYFGRNLLPTGPPASVWGARTEISALRWEVVRGQIHSPASGSAYNLDEAEAVVRLLSSWLDELDRQAAAAADAPGATGFVGPRPGPERGRVPTVAVVTPFARQRDLLLHKLAALLPDGYEEVADICVLHVNALAGRCFDVVLASLVLSGESPAVHQAYLARHPEFVYGLLTAARQSLMVVGDPAAVGALGGIWSDLVACAGETPPAEPVANRDRNRDRDQDQDQDQDQVAAPGEILTPDQSLSLIAEGPYPPGSRAMDLAYQELFLMQNGWRGERRIGSQ